MVRLLALSRLTVKRIEPADSEAWAPRMVMPEEAPTLIGISSEWLRTPSVAVTTTGSAGEASHASALTYSVGEPPPGNDTTPLAMSAATHAGAVTETVTSPV